MGRQVHEGDTISIFQLRRAPIRDSIIKRKLKRIRSEHKLLTTEQQLENPFETLFTWAPHRICAAVGFQVQRSCLARGEHERYLQCQSRESLATLSQCDMNAHGMENYQMRSNFTLCHLVKTKLSKFTGGACAPAARATDRQIGRLTD